MKITLYLVTFLSLFAGSIFAQKGLNLQVSFQPGLSSLLGDKYSMTSNGYTSVTWTDYTQSPIYKNNTFGFTGGFNSLYNFTNNFGISIGANYARKGQHYADVVLYEIGNTLPFKFKNKVSLSYLNIPLCLNFNTNPEKSISFTWFAGIYIDVLLGYSDTYKKTHGDYYYNQVMHDGEITVDYGNAQGGKSVTFELVGDPYKMIDFGVTTGAGIQKKLSEKLYLVTTINYQLGFYDIKNLNCKYSPPNDPNRSMINRNAMLGLTIGLKRTF